MKVKATLDVTLEILTLASTHMLASRGLVQHCRTTNQPHHHSLTSFRLHIGGVSTGKVYFECCIESMGGEGCHGQIGVVAYDWYPVQSTGGVGDDAKGTREKIISIRSQYQISAFLPRSDTT